MIFPIEVPFTKNEVPGLNDGGTFAFKSQYLTRKDMFQILFVGSLNNVYLHDTTLETTEKHSLLNKRLKSSIEELLYLCAFCKQKQVTPLPQVMASKNVTDMKLEVYPLLMNYQVYCKCFEPRLWVGYTVASGLVVFFGRKNL